MATTRSTREFAQTPISSRKPGAPGTSSSRIATATGPGPYPTSLATPSARQPPTVHRCPGPPNASPWAPRETFASTPQSLAPISSQALATLPHRSSASSSATCHTPVTQRVARSSPSKPHTRTTPRPRPQTPTWSGTLT